MNRISIYGVELTSNEEVVDAFNPTFFRFILHYFISLGLLLIGAYIYYYDYNLPGLEVSRGVYLLYTMGSGLLWLILTLIANNSELLVITTKRIIYKKGVLNINTTDIDLDKIQNTKVHQSFIERLFNYGTFCVDTSGSEGFEIVFKGMPSVSRKRAMIKSVMEKDLDAVKEHKRRVDIEKKLESKEKLLGKLKKDIKELETVIEKEKK